MDQYESSLGIKRAIFGLMHFPIYAVFILKVVLLDRLFNWIAIDSPPFL